MKKLLIFYFIAFSGYCTSAQTTVAGAGNTYAVIVGISSYLDPGITPLQFANRDAEEFATFLKSESGGKVPEGNIRLLLDSNATTAAVYDAMYWLKKSCRANDLVYFYFSGHGDLENVTLHKTGYLICYNSPPVNYIHMALSIDHLNAITNTLSAETDADVVLITDACHSGKLAGDNFRGGLLAAEQLLAVQQKEIRIASCKTDQLSNEKLDWGGGRGVFSYYLINGLKGLADNSNDGTVSAGEIKKYLEMSLANDPVLKSENTVQTPVINGNEKFILSKVDNESASQARNLMQTDSANNAMILGTAAPVSEEISDDPETYFFSQLKKESLEALTDSLKLKTLRVDDIPLALISYLQSKTQSAGGTTKLETLTNELRNSPERLESLNSFLVVAFDDRGQDVIRQYINGDEAELEKRRYYNVNSSGYDIYPDMFAVALKLTKPDNFFYNILKVKLHYFTGVALRLKIPVSENADALIDQAFAEQKKALALEGYAAYIYNELGILFQYKNKTDSAEKYFKKAAELAPAWAIPQANLCGLYGYTNKYEKGFAACQIADSLQAGLQNTSVNRGFIYEQRKNFLLAEEYYRQAIDINTRHFLPFERLGYVYLNTTNYAKSDSFFYEADLRKQGYHFKGNDWMVNPMVLADAAVAIFRCPVDTQKIKPTDIFAFFCWGVQEYQSRNYINANRILRKVVALDKNNPLVFHYLGKLYYDQQEWEAAEVMFTFAIKYYLQKNEFDAYVDSVKRSATYPYDHTCFEKFFEVSYYKQVEDFYFAGTMHENWNHPDEAEMYFRRAIEKHPEQLGGYIKLWQLQERLGRFTEAESTIKSFGQYNAELSERELNEFYRRTIEKFEFNGDWNYRLGLLLYSRAQAKSRTPYFDSIVWFPKINKELYIDFDLYSRLGKADSLSLFDLSATGSRDVFTLDYIREIGQHPYEVPGTGESINLADAIYMPRKDGIHYLNRAAGLLKEIETIADINFKIGNIYVWAGSKKQAYPFYARSVKLVPGNANARLSLVEVCAATFKNRAAMEQLQYLYDSSQINFEKRMLFAEFSIHAGQFDRASALLTEAEIIHPYALPTFSDLHGRLLLLSGKPGEAIKFYEQYLSRTTDDGSAAYTLARIYARSGKTKKAWEWINKALDAGFNYSFVLETDPDLTELRKSNKWAGIKASYVAKRYNVKKSQLAF